MAERQEIPRLNTKPSINIWEIDGPKSTPENAVAEDIIKAEDGPVTFLDLSPIVYTADDLAPRIIPVDMNKKRYYLMEGSADAVMKYKSAQTRGAKLVSTGQKKADGTDDSTIQFGDGMSEADLIFLRECLCRSNPHKPDEISRDPTGTPVKIDMTTVKNWPYHLQKGLYERAKAITRGLEEKETPESLQKQIDGLQKKLAKLKPTEDSPEPKSETEEEVGN